ncbi:unnamed protein product [Protopolystoma xenopodis]|uniref:Uncharacterized protein n=1 Tax=Protopolystoma xenopodis TaxID=117903 RepID=A0A448WUI0_9PLAT|nr:unnamed protein product [Protopolystoma xenopodis]
MNGQAHWYTLHKTREVVVPGARRAGKSANTTAESVKAVKVSLADSMR